MHVTCLQQNVESSECQTRACYMWLFMTRLTRGVCLTGEGPALPPPLLHPAAQEGCCGDTAGPEGALISCQSLSLSLRKHQWVKHCRICCFSRQKPHIDIKLTAHVSNNGIHFRNFKEEENMKHVLL